MSTALSALSRACVAVACLVAPVACNALTGVEDLSVADGTADGGLPPGRGLDGGAPGDAASQPDAVVALPFTHHRTVTLTARGVAPKAPILVVLPASFPYDHLKPSGDDLRFGTSATQAGDVAYFVETWSPGGESHVWLRPTSLPASGTLHMFYGNDEVGSASDFAAVFPNAQRTAGGGAGSLTATAKIAVDWFELRAGDTLSLTAGTALEITAARIIIAGTIDGKGRGAAGGSAGGSGSGPGGGLPGAAGSASGGGGYAGPGGKGGSDGAGGGAGGAAYGTPSGDDIAFGSGGAAADNRAGGAGGGGISIIGSRVSASGTIDANGLDGQGAAGQTAGGGSGGGILVAGLRVDLGGATLTAKGGGGGTCVDAANDGGGGGSGGRIKIRHAGSYVPPTTTNVAFGAGAKQPCAAAGGVDGAPGTTHVATSTTIFGAYDATLGPEAP